VAADMKPELCVTVWVGELTTGAERLIPAARSRADSRRGRNVAAVTSEDDPELTVTFVLNDVNEDDAREAGHAVLSALEADDDSIWTVTVLERF
jgi:hypothetical protein